MPARTVADLIDYLKEIQLYGRPPPVLLLGAGASKGAGLAAMDELFEHIGLNPKDGDVRDRFCDYISRKTALQRYELLEEFLQSMDPAEVTPGYRALADLCAARFFDLVLTANFDPLLDDALASANLKRRHYVLLINGVIRPERMNLLLSQPEPRLKVIKLHGDLFYRQMAWTAAEMDDYLEGIGPQLTAAVAGRDFLTVGYSLKDARIIKLILGSGGAIWFTNYSEHPVHLVPGERSRLHEVVSTDCAFESLFTTLARELEVTPAAVPPIPLRPAAPIRKPAAVPRATKVPAGPPAAVKGAVPAASTVDDLLASLVGVWNPKFGLISMTGFVLAEPRVIVVDGCMSDPKITGFEIGEIVTSRGQHLPTRPIRLVAGDRFGPLLLEVPPELEVPGLRVDATRVQAGLGIQVGVAVRHETPFPPRRREKPPRKEKVAFGLSNGRVADGVEHALKLSGFHCGHAVSLACAVAPGASGAPVVDRQMAVRGFIIGGSADFKNPLSYMFPTFRWGRLLR